MTKLNAFIGWFLILALFSLYLYGSFLAIYISWTKSGDGLVLREGLDAAISSINALLLTNLGAVLGISVTNPTSALARNILPKRAVAGDQDKENQEREVKLPMDSREQIQLYSVIVLLIVLLACLVTYACKGWTSDIKVLLPFVSQGAKLFIGVAIAYITFILGVKQN